MLILAVAAAAAGLVGCVGFSTEVAPLEDVEWVLESYGEAGDMTPALTTAEVTAELSSENDELTGSAGCNSYFGGYEADGSRLSLVGPMAITEMACLDDDIMDQEARYLDILSAAQSYTIEGGKLMIECGGETLVFKQK